MERDAVTREQLRRGIEAANRVGIRTLNCIFCGEYFGLISDLAQHFAERHGRVIV